MTASTPSAPPKAAHELEIAKLFQEQGTAGWRIPMQLTQAMPLAAFAADVDRPKHSAPAMLVDVVLPCPELSDKSAARFQCGKAMPRYQIRISEAQWCSACATATLFGVPLTAAQVLALLVGERLAALARMPPGSARPFVVNWLDAIAALARVTTQMLWQDLAVIYDRVAVHKVSAQFRRDAMELTAQWKSAPAPAAP